jgi:HSP20 family protein
MALMRWRPLSSTVTPSLWDLTDWVDPFVGRGLAAQDLLSDGGFSPNIESYTKGNELHLRAEIPGVNPKDVDIEVEDIHLCIRGVRSRDESLKDFDYGIEEMTYGGFERCFHIPRNADVQKMHAKYDNGLLDISIPLTKTGQGKHIPIEGVKEGK